MSEDAIEVRCAACHYHELAESAQQGTFADAWVSGFVAGLWVTDPARLAKNDGEIRLALCRAHLRAVQETQQRYHDAAAALAARETTH